MTTILQRHRQTDGQTNCRSNTALCLALRVENTRQVQLFPACEKKSSQEYREFKTVVEADSSKQNMSEIQKQNRKLRGDEKRENGKL